mmetsp:Transcript_13070/g.15225  ORF Transcript_13070/g.15225 Transcript_13070/m.15225 type:complete len:110 (+) Transcript_13070:235-564(+)
MATLATATAITNHQLIQATQFIKVPQPPLIYMIIQPLTALATVTVTVTVTMSVKVRVIQRRAMIHSVTILEAHGKMTHRFGFHSMFHFEHHEQVSHSLFLQNNHEPFLT